MIYRARFHLLVLALHGDMVIMLLILMTLWKHYLTTPPIRSQILCTAVVAVSGEEQEDQHM